MKLLNWLRNQEPSNLAEKHFQEGIDLGLRGCSTEAIQQFSKALSLSPSLAKARVARASAYSILRRWDEAIADFSEVLSSNPKSVEALEGRAFAYISKANEIVERYQRAGWKNYQFSAEELDIPLDKLSNSVTPGKAIWAQKTIELMELHNAARQDAKKALELDPTCMEMHHLLKELSE